jgi:hypothetical protein
MKRLLKHSAWLLVPSVLVALVFAIPASAGPDNPRASGLTDPSLLALIGNDDLFSTADLSVLLAPAGSSGNGTQHFGPFPSSSSDSGTCGIQDWAQDTFDRHFTVRSNGSGGGTVVEQFKDGRFITNTTASPGACETGSKHGSTIVAGKTGSMHGYFIISNVGSQTSTSPYCNAVAMTNDNCDTQTFIETHFTCTYQVTCQVTTFFFHYAAGDQSLLYHEWRNASDDRGGNSGDIATS